MIELQVRKQLRDFALDVEVGFERGVTVLSGPSGAGKSTLMRLIAGLERPDRGRIVVDGRVLTEGRHEVPPFRRGVAYVFQDYALFPHLDVLANVGFGLRARGVAQAARDTAARGWLERLGLAGLAAARPGALSGGERQRVALARALVWDPAAVLLDEPFAALDPATRGRVRSELRALLTTLNVPVVLVTHDSEDTAAFDARVVRLERGAIVG
jgi:ABC-type sulfate/molybdate transport systems ATPase subunit